MSKEYKIQFTKSARKEFLSLPKKSQINFEEILIVLSRNPYTNILSIKKIKGQDGLFRVRSGDYRLIYFVDKKEIIVLVVRLGHRKDVNEGYWT